MSLKWTDVLEIAIQLAESKPDVDPMSVHSRRHDVPVNQIELIFSAKCQQLANEFQAKIATVIVMAGS